MRIALIQNNPQPGQLEQNVTHGLEALAQAAANGAALALLPEMWPRSFVDALKPSADDQTWPALLTRWRQACKQAGIASIGGLPRQAADGRFYNSLFAIDANGEIQARYDKLHLFAHMDEHLRYAPGAAIATLPLSEFNLGLSICYDLRFPELYRCLRQQNADVFVAIAQWPSERLEHWRTLLRARAIENLCYVVGVNRCGIVAAGDKRLAFPGHSAVIAPWGEVLAELDEREQIAYVDLQRERVDAARAGFRNWQDRRIELGGIKPA